MFDHTDEIRYHLPVSCVRVTGSITDSYDTIREKRESTPEATISLESMAASPKLKAKIESGLLRDTNVAFELTDDGRLVSSSIESMGQAGKAVLGVVSVGAAIAGAVAGLSPAAVGGPVAVAAGLVARDGEPGSRAIEKARRAPEKKDPVAEAYEEDYPHMVALKEHYAKLIIDLGESFEKALEDVNQPEDSAGGQALVRARRLRQALEFARAELERLDAHFKAWRATTLYTRVEQHEYLLTLDELHTVAQALYVKDRKLRIDQDGKLGFDELGKENGAEPGNSIRAVEEVWDTLGVVVIPTGSPSPNPRPPTQPGDNEILVRIPRRETLALYKKGNPGRPDEGQPVLVESRSYLVMDNCCDTATVVFRKSLWAKRSKTVKFSSIGALSAFSSTSTSTGAALAEAAQGTPAAITGGLEQSKKIYDQLAALRDRSLDERLARIKKEVELKQQEIAQAGLLATEGSFAELERLKQEAEILEKRKTIAD